MSTRFDRRSGRWLLLVVVMVTSWPAGPYAQDVGRAPSKSNLRIVTFGGFLGYVDGLEAPPDGPYGPLTGPKGGLIGIQDWLTTQSRFVRGKDLLLVTGNNLPIDVRGPDVLTWTSTNADDMVAAYWTRLANLHPDAVAFSIDDFLRSLRFGNMAGLLAQAINSPAAPPFVVSNAIIRRHQKGLNTTVRPGWTLDVPADASVGWLKKLQLSCAKCSAVSATLTEAPSSWPSQPITVSAAPPDSGHVALTLSRPLRPERRYTLSVVPAGGLAAVSFTFWTHTPLTKLTPRGDGDSIPLELQGLPIRYATRRLEGAGPASYVPAAIIIVAMVEPGTKASLGTDRWKWRPQVAACPADECEIDFLPASETFDIIAAYTSQSIPKPVFVLLSGLLDRETLQLLSKAPDIRFVALDPDSSVLGQDLGYEAVLNHQNPKTTRLWARPGWIGTSVDILSAHMKWAEGAWQLESPRTAVEYVKGKKLAWNLTSRPNQIGEIEYFASDPQTKIAGPFDLYPAYPGMLDAHTSQGKLWEETREMAALLLDIMRNEAHADIALLPGDFIDADIIEWLKQEVNRTKRLDWLSRFVLARALYRTERIVTVNVEGSKLVDALDSLIKAQAQPSETLIAAGLGAKGALARIDKTRARVNGREIVPAHFYKIALPQSLAEAQKLHAGHDSLSSLLDGVDARMRRASGAMPPATESLASQLENQFARRPRVYFSATPVRFDYHDASVTESEKGVFGTIPFAGRSVKAERQWSAVAQADLGCDFLHVALRGTADAKFSKKTIGGTISYPTDEWTLGPRLDVKTDVGPLHRLFVGVFRQSWFRDHADSAITPTRTVEIVDPVTGVVTKATVSGDPVTPVTLRPTYDFLRSGIDLEPAKAGRWAAIKSAAVAFDVGKTRKDRDSISIGSAPARPIEDLFHFGMKRLVEDAFQADAIAYANNHAIAFNYSDHQQQRLQLDGAIDITPPFAWLHQMKLTTTAQFRYYFDSETDPRPKFTPDRSLDLQNKIEWPVINHIKVGPFVNYYRVTAKGATGPFVYLDYGIAVDVPIFFAFRHGRLFQ